MGQAQPGLATSEGRLPLPAGRAVLEGIWTAWTPLPPLAGVDINRGQCDEDCPQDLDGSDSLPPSAPQTATWVPAISRPGVIFHHQSSAVLKLGSPNQGVPVPPLLSRKPTFSQVSVCIP